MGHASLTTGAGRARRVAQLLRERGGQSEVVEALIAAIEETLRRRSGPSEELAVLRSIAGWIAAPFVLDFAAWSLRRASELGLRRVYFLARDGQLPYRVARELLAEASEGLQVEYLHVSRQSCSHAAAIRVDAEEVLWQIGNSYRSGLDEMLLRLGAGSDAGRADAAAAGLGLGPLDPHAALTFARVAAAGRTGAELAARAAAQRPLVHDYLRSTGFLSPGPVAVVDLGGIGSHLRSLRQLREGLGEVVGLFATRAPLPLPLVLARSTRDATGPDLTIHSYFEREVGRATVSSQASAMIQTFCAADHGSVLSYRKTARGTEPAHAPTDPHQSGWQVGEVQDTVVGVAATLRRMGVDVDRLRVREGATALLNDFAAEPTREEALAWGRFPMEAVGSHRREVAPFAEPYDWSDLVRTLGRGALPGGWTRWQAGSIALSSPVLRWALAGLRTGRRLIRQSRVETAATKMTRATDASSDPAFGLLNGSSRHFTPDRSPASAARDALRLRRLLGNSRALQRTWPGPLRRSSWRPPAPRLLTIDVFDTVLTRSVLRPSAVFHRLASGVDRLEGIGVSGQELVEARHRAWRRLHSERGVDPTFEEMYRALAGDLGITIEAAERIAELEMAIEKEVSRPVVSMIRSLEAARPSFERVVFLSDMYLPSRFIRSLLIDAGAWHEGDEIWVSAEAWASKRRGDLFQRFCDAMGIEANECLHVGNDRIADSAAPRWMGFQVAHAPVANPSAAESALAGQAAAPGDELAGALRLARLRLLASPGSPVPLPDLLLAPLAVAWAAHLEMANLLPEDTRLAASLRGIARSSGTDRSTRGEARSTAVISITCGTSGSSNAGTVGPTLFCGSESECGCDPFLPGRGSTRPWAAILAGHMRRILLAEESPGSSTEMNLALRTYLAELDSGRKDIDRAALVRYLDILWKSGELR
jgi:FMN phosphatase YigB (HAD superfamily)